MSKKINTTNEVAINPTKSLQKYFEEYENVSIRKIAAASNLNYGYLLKLSKNPIPGEAYSPDAINWTAVEKQLINHGINWMLFNWDELNEGATRKGATLCKDMEQFTVGTKVYLRKDNSTPYEIVYKTATHVVLMKENTSEPIAWSNNTFLINGPAFQPRTEKKVEEQ